MSITRYEMTIHLVTESPVHSGGIDEVVDRSRQRSERVAVPRRFARDGNGHPVLTGRSVKGAVRAACEKYLSGDAGAAVREQLGSGWKGMWGTTSSGESRAATLTFHTVDLAEAAQREGGSAWESGTADAADTHPVADSVALATRTGIAVNRYWGAAGDTALFEHEYVPAERPLTLTITAQTGRMSVSGGRTELEAAGPEPATESQVEQLFAVIIGLLDSGRVAFGGRRNAGWGRVRLADDRPWTLTRSRLGTREDLLTWLDGGEDVTTAIDPVSCTESERIRITISWDSPTGILVAKPRPELAERDEHPREGERGHSDDQQDMTYTEPLRSGPDPCAPFVLPGSSVRGALRSQASRIARTVLAARQPTSIDCWSTYGVHDQLAADPALVRDLFGSTDRRGALRVLDTLASDQTRLRTVVHNAGDRWTGGVAEGLLYGEKVPDTTWNDLVLELDPRSLPGTDDRRRAAWCLLGLTLAELAAGTLPLGSRGTRGLGQIHVTRVRVDGGADIVGDPWDFKDPGGDAADREDGAKAVPIAAQILARLQALTITSNPEAGVSWTGWSSYLCETKEACRD
ncbi:MULTISPECIES: RAMP superfamily CRISPR-associated protein [Actinomyces]|uniref:CRISPR-associated protein n=1 Tax=Actinomyces respiraculi TaxID=2744574 RepID=A0A7T0PWR6_9ACTO|nr:MULTISPECIES: RAMP superfamily CRISPR-associated protein [Actinomyces]QPL05120.1 CRISPR-associated protein [Actinomyces respiraculi]